MSRRALFLVVTSIAFLSCKPAGESAITPEEIRAIAKEAYVYGFPMVDNYRILHSYSVDTASPEYKGEVNTVHSVARVYTPEDKAVQTPNSDTPYSMLTLDLRAEPIVLTVPTIEKGRYYSLQFIDLYTHNFAYVGSRVTGNEGASYLVAGPDWTGEKPDGIKEVIRSETQLTMVIYRTQLFGPADLDNVKKIQAGYALRPLSDFTGKPSAVRVAAIDWVKPVARDELKTSPDVFRVLNWLLKYTSVDSSEVELRKRFEKIGIGPGLPFDVASLPADRRQAIEAGIADAWTDFAAVSKQIDAREVTSGDLFGTREYLRNNYLYRMAGAMLGIYGNSKDEAMYPAYAVDSDGQKLSGANSYTLRFPPNELPPANAFWSLTMYEMPASLLVANPLNRYLINSPMLPKLKRDADGGITLYVQNKSPGKARESNWLPAPAGDFAAVLRIYWPKEEALNGTWKAPPLKKTP
jgi:hypothetical protein